MRHYSNLPPPADTPLPENGPSTLRMLWPYLWEYKIRLILALTCLVAAKVANVYVPLVFKQMVDALDGKLSSAGALLIVPATLVLAYGVLRFSSSAFTELRELLFARVTQQAVRKISLAVFVHLHSLSLRFHLERQTGGLSRDIERGTRAIGSLISFTLYSILPTIIEIIFVIGILLKKYSPIFAITTLVTLLLYGTFTIVVTNWRNALRRKANELDSTTSASAIDSLINYETVKYFNNEHFESLRYDAQLGQWTQAKIINQYSLSALNVGQALIIAGGVTVIMWLATKGVSAGTMTLGDLVLVNAFMIQLYIPLNFLGVMYREIRQALIDIERLFSLLQQNREIADANNAQPLAAGPIQLEFANVSFSYDKRRNILNKLSFVIPAGKTVAVVGHSGSGKSTLARLIYRFYDIEAGQITINGQDIRSLTQDSLRAAIAIVPQDTVLFNDSLRYNIMYGLPTASKQAFAAAIRTAQLEEFITRLPDGLETKVGERGLKLSGGEKQRVAIARALLKNPALMIFDEASSALDSKTEQAIQAQLDIAAQGRTSLMIAHRLSTIIHADEILVMEHGQIVERGNHPWLLQQAATYAAMWALQQQEQRLEQ